MVTGSESGDRRRPLTSILTALGAVAVIVATVWLIPLGGDDEPPPTTAGEGGAATTQPAPEQRLSAGELDDELPLPEGSHAVAAAWDGSRFWVIATGEPVEPGEGPSGEVRVLSVDPEDGSAPIDVPVDGAPVRIAADVDGVWLAGESGSITVLDPGTGEAMGTVDLPGSPAVGDMTLVGGSLWVATEAGPVVEVATAIAEVQETVDLPADRSGRMVVEGGELWVMPRSGATGTRIDPIDASSVEVPFDGVTHDIAHLAFEDVDVLVAGNDGDRGTVTVLDPSTLEPVREIPVPAPVAGLGWVAGSFGAIDEEAAFLRIPSTATGGEPDRLATTWDGEAPLVPVDRETWTLADEGVALARVLLTGPAG